LLHHRPTADYPIQRHESNTCSKCRWIFRHSCYKSYIRSIEHPFERGFPMNNPHPPITLTSRGRLVIGLVLTFFALLAWIVLGGGTADASTDQPRPVSQLVVVQPGESLWSIATDIAPDQDPRAVIMRIREINDLGTQHVHPGQSLAVPAY